MLLSQRDSVLIFVIEPLCIINKEQKYTTPLLLLYVAMIHC